MKTIRVLIADESVFIRQQLSKMLAGREGITVIGGAGNGSEAVVKTVELYPSIVLMGCQMPLVSGFEALEKIRELTGIPVIMMLINRKNPEADRREALEKGAADCIVHRAALLSKDILELTHEVVSMIRRIAAHHEEKKLARPQPKTVNTPIPAVPKVSPEKPMTKKPYARRHLPPGVLEIVVIGISTGGPPALQELIARLPAGLPVPIVVVQHIPAEFTQSLARRLDVVSHLEVKEAKHGMRLSGGMVYLAPGGTQVLIAADRTVIISDEEYEVPYAPSVDVLTSSVVEVYGGRALGVMMTGMGNDGLLGFRALHQAGGYIIAQDEESSVIYGMPKAVIDDAIVHEIHSLSDLPEAIASCFKLHACAPAVEKRLRQHS
jgi:two-component system chemotaxis response regulator CheB